MKYILCMFLLFVGISATTYQANAAPMELFGTREYRSADLDRFDKWQSMFERYEQQRQLYDGECSVTDSDQIRQSNICNFVLWDRMINSLVGQTRMTQLHEVNKRMNKFAYTTDSYNWQKSDFWATPFEFFAYNGDCEDFAIAKYITLRSLGFSEQDMRVVILQDENLNQVHAVLAVRLQNKVYILDNQIKEAIDHQYIKHYRPIFSINETAWWKHR